MLLHWIDLFLFLVAIIAGIMDTLVGGGGLITLPVLVFSGLDVITALGTSKMQSALGECSAGIRYYRAGKLKFRGLGKALIFTVIGCVCGTFLLQSISVSFVNGMTPWLLLLVLLYYLLAPRTREDMERDSLPEKPKMLPVLGSGVGFYNGFFGPGTGVICTVLLMNIYKLRINAASIYTKPFNICGNMMALILFIMVGNVDYGKGFMMGIGSLIGGQIGASLVMYKNSSFLRVVFLSLMTIMVIYSFAKFYGIGFLGAFNG